MPHCFQPARRRLRRTPKISNRSSTVVAVALGVAIFSLGVAEAAAHADVIHRHLSGLQIARFTSGPPPEHVVLRERTVWEGADLDGDGQPDIANPTGKAPRVADAYGEGRFHASRDGGARQHEGVDYVARIGYAYPDDNQLRYVEIDNPALHLTARVFYVDPTVAVGDSVAMGHPIGEAHTLQHRYPLGITDHVHLEIADRRGRKMDAQTLIVARTETDRLAAD
jgi:hypothetical protein